MLRGLNATLGEQGLTPSAVMPVAGIDEGTLDDRLRDAGVRGAVVGKTGTLNSVSALAGYIYTRSEGVVLFAIMNRGGSPASFRPLQDLLVREVLDACGGAAAPGYAKRSWKDALSGSVVSPDESDASASIPARPRRQTAEKARPAAPAIRGWGVAPAIEPLRARWSRWVTPDALFDIRTRTEG
jgi:hypothetical protein